VFILVVLYLSEVSVIWRFLSSQLTDSVEEVIF